MNYIEAMILLKTKKGIKIRRANWGCKDNYLHLENDVILNYDKDFDFDFPYVANVFDSLAKDWVEYKKVEKSILDKEETEYLNGVLMPFKDKINCIKLRRLSVNKEHVFLTVYFKNFDFISFPTFKEGNMYKGMEVDKCYTPKQLGLFDKKVL